ncbi:restriction endonuclease [Niallia sp. Sow4_A1]|uniref:restriction endonuclease n=1 Tax=unclassified Niallia TaxID=2837522 RepID=UPI00203FC415|nr:restriction endonuclease [Niallia sp. MER TA 168]MCM3363763.1 restriction endonuclease [Niallia sp. MER TA 168]
MAKRRKYKRRKKGILPNIVIVIFGIYLLFMFIIQFTVQVINDMKTMISSLGIKEWACILLFAAFLYFLYHLAKVKEKKYQEWRMQERKRELEEYKKRQIQQMQDKAKLDEIKNMDAFEFERFIKEMFELIGYKGKLTPKTNDGGKDIILKDGKDILLVECKRYTSKKVSRTEIQKLHSAIIDMNAKKGYFVTTSEYSKYAIDYAANKEIELINGDQLINMLKNINRERERYESLREDTLGAEKIIVYF